MVDTHLGDDADVGPIVLGMLEKVNVDYLGVSLDALLIYCTEKASKKVISDLGRINIKCSEIGYVNDSNQVKMVYSDNREEAILPKFRESAYTKIKQKIGELNPDLMEEMENKIESAFLNAIEKRKKIIEYIKK